MADRPIVMSSPMIRALAREADAPGTGKTQTRRIINPSPPGLDLSDCTWRVSEGFKRTRADPPWMHAVRPFGSTGATEIVAVCRVPCRVGDHLWVREAIYYGGDSNWYYAADRVGIGVEGCLAVRHFKRDKAPAMFMPRMLSRFTLTVKQVRVERLNDISEGDAIAEGVWTAIPCPGREGQVNHIGAYANLWESLHEPGAWQDNPFVVAITFSVTRANIDSLSKSEAA